MTYVKQPNLFGEDQAELFSEDVVAPVYTPDPERVRRRLSKILSEARAAGTMPWDSASLSLYRTIFPQMTNCLPDDEAAQLRFEFAEELERLKAA